MKVLHYVDNLDPMHLFTATSAINKVVEDASTSDVSLVYRKGDAEAVPSEIKTIQVKNRQDWLSTLYDEMPNIVHVHCQWNRYSKTIIKTAKKRGFNVVVTVERTLSPLRHFISLKRADRIIVGLEEDKSDTFLRLANPHVSVIKDTLLDTTVTDTREKTDVLYNKIKFKHYDVNMSTSTIQALYTLIRMNVKGDVKDMRPKTIITEEEKENLTLLNDDDWIMLGMFATENGISNLLAKTIDRYGIDTKGVKMPRNSSEKEEKEDIFDIIKDIKNDSEKKIYNIKDAIALYRRIRNNDFDEIEVDKKLKSLKLRKTADKIEKQLVEEMGLEEGYIV